MANPRRLGALACALLLTMASVGHASEPVTFNGSITLPTGVTSTGQVPVSSTNPLPVTSTSATQATPGSDATKATAVQGITGGTPIHAALVDSTGTVVDVSQNAIVSGAISITNTGGARTASLQQNRGSDGLSNTGSDANAILEARAYLHGWDPNASTWGRMKMSQTYGTVTSPYGLPAESWRTAAASGGVESSTADNTIQAANATKVHCITDMSVSYGTLSGVAEFIVKDGSTVVFRERLDTVASRFSRTFGRPICGTANTAMVWALGASVTGKVYANFGGITE